jgi:histidinol-phosphate/aromatic aminotransferase/cobyric acid decarboxylase-like protein
LCARQPEWSVKALACAVLPELLAATDLPRWCDAIARLRADLVELLTGYGLIPEPSDAPYVLVRAAAGWRDHLARGGVLVRDTTNFGIPDGIRIAVPPAVELHRLAEALDGSRRL